MRVGIVNFHGSYNYGSLLLTYALQRKMEEKGCEVEIINYLSFKQRNQYTLPIIVSRNPVKRFIERLFWIPYIKGMRQKYRKFDLFRNKYLNMTKEYDDFDSLKSIDDSFDLLISGSDQIWNLNCYDFSWAYYLTFSNKPKKVSYAPSIGHSMNDLGNENKSKLINALMNYQYISVRDSNTQNFIKSLINIKPEIVLDPTMLLTKDEWSSLAGDTPLIQGKYIFYYDPFDHKEGFKLAQEYGKKKGIKVITSNVYQAFYQPLSTFKHKLDCGPIEFLNLIKYANTCIGRSFHLAVFCILFHKQFIIVNGESDERIKELYKMFEIENYSNNQLITLNTENIDSILTKERIKSNNFINTCLKKD